MLPDATLREARSLLAACRARDLVMATAESVTAGLIAATLTASAGASDVFDRGFVTYSNAAKNQLPGFPRSLIEAHDSISEPVAAAMADGALANSRAGIAVSATGGAGPGGGSADKPVGLVCFGLLRGGMPVVTQRRIVPGDRTAICAAAVARAFIMIRAA